MRHYLPAYICNKQLSILILASQILSEYNMNRITSVTAYCTMPAQEGNYDRVQLNGLKQNIWLGVLQPGNKSTLHMFSDHIDITWMAWRLDSNDYLFNSLLAQAAGISNFPDFTQTNFDFQVQITLKSKVSKQITIGFLTMVLCIFDPNLVAHTHTRTHRHPADPCNQMLNIIHVKPFYLCDFWIPISRSGPYIGSQHHGILGDIVSQWCRIYVCLGIFF